MLDVFRKFHSKLLAPTVYCCSIVYIDVYIYIIIYLQPECPSFLKAVFKIQSFGQNTGCMPYFEVKYRIFEQARILNFGFQ